MLVITTNVVEGKKVTRYIGIVSGGAILGANIFRDFFAGIRDIVGGRSAAAWFRLGDIERAAIEWETSLRLSRELGDNSLMAWSLGGLADVARLRREYNRAVELFKEGLKLYQELGNKSEPPYTLEALGLAAAALGKSQHAARLWGAAASWREAINEPLPLTFQKDYAASINQARSQLGEEAYESAWSEGHAMSPEQAIALAFEE